LANLASPIRQCPVHRGVRKNQRVAGLEGPGNPVPRNIDTDIHAASATADLGFQDPSLMRRCRDRERPLITRAVAKRHPKRMVGCAANMHFVLVDAASPNDFPPAQPTTVPVPVYGPVPSPPSRCCCFDHLFVGTTGSDSFVRKSLILIIPLARPIPSPLKLAEVRKRLDDHLRGDLGLCAASLACI
jgi:hypothetical protein